MPFILIAVFIVASIVGYLIINNVPTLLHTPLMSGMNALSGITVLGALAVTAIALKETNSTLSAVLGVAAIVLAACGFSLLKSHAESVPVKWYGRVDRQVLLRTAAAIGVSLVCLLLTGAVFASGLWAVSRVLGGIAATAASCLLALVAMLLPVPLVVLPLQLKKKQNLMLY